MAALKLTYCQLIRIILAQIGGSPLMPLYTQLAAGMPTMIVGGNILQAAQQVKDFIDTVTNTLNTLAKTANDYNNLAQNLANQFFQNPLATSLDAASTALNTRIAALDCSGAGAGTDECILLANTLVTVNNFKTNTDLLSGVTEPNPSSGKCSLQDLLGSGCARNTGVPDIELTAIRDSFKNKAAIDQLTSDINRLISGAIGFTALQTSITNLRNSLLSLNVTFDNVLNKAMIRQAVVAAVNQVVFNLLSGCGNNILEDILKPDVKTKLQPYVELMAYVQDPEKGAYMSQSGQIISNTGEVITLSNGEQIQTIKADSTSNKYDANISLPTYTFT